VSIRMLNRLSRIIRWGLTSSGHIFLVFAGVSLAVSVVLLITVIRNMEQGGALRDIQIQERLTYTARMVTEHVESGIQQIRGALRSLNDISNDSTGSDSSTEPLRAHKSVVHILAAPLSVNTQPDSILTYPPVLWDGPPSYSYDVLSDGTLYELDQDWRQAVSYYKRPRRTDEYSERWDAFFHDPQVQLLSEFRLARSAANGGNVEEALDCYQALRDENILLPVGIPVGLLARYARCLLFDDLGRITERDREARILIQWLENGRYTLTYPTYRYYLNATNSLIGSDTTRNATGVDSIKIDQATFPIDEAVNWAWRDWIEQRQSLSPEGLSFSSIRTSFNHIAVCWAGSAERMVAIVAPASAIIEAFFPRLLQIPFDRQTFIQITDTDERVIVGDSRITSDPRAIQTSLGTALSWRLTLWPTAEMVSDNATTKRQTTQFIIIGMLVVSMLVSGYSLSRTISQELAVIKIKSDFISTVSHELRSPLTAIRQMSELLEDGRFQGDDERIYYLDGIQDETKRLQNMIEDLLSFRSMETDAYRLDRKKMNLTEAVLRTVEDFKDHHPTYIDHITFTASRPEIVVLGDQGAIDRAIRNLLDNAVKYSTDEVRIDVAISASEKAVNIEITDSGIGIPANEQERIFNQFVRGEAAREKQTKGTGIGLSIVHHIIEAHQGTIQVTSAPGEGSIFTITLPLGVEIPP